MYIFLRVLLYRLVGGNPLTVMANQISMELHKIRQKCPLYETHGKSVCTWHEHCSCIFLKCKSSYWEFVRISIVDWPIGSKTLQEYDDSKITTWWVHSLHMSIDSWKTWTKFKHNTLALCSEQNSHCPIDYFNKEGALSNCHFYWDGVFKVSEKCNWKEYMPRII